MTQQELNEYNKLNSSGKMFYNAYMKDHPEATHVQAMTYAKICGGIEIDVGPIDIKKIIIAAIRQAREWIRTEVPRIFNQVSNALDNLLNRVATAAVNTWEAFKKFLGDLFN